MFVSLEPMRLRNRLMELSICRGDLFDIIRGLFLNRLICFAFLCHVAKDPTVYLKNPMENQKETPEDYSR